MRVLVSTFETKRRTDGTTKGSTFRRSHASLYASGEYGDLALPFVICNTFGGKEGVLQVSGSRDNRSSVMSYCPAMTLKQRMLRPITWSLNQRSQKYIYHFFSRFAANDDVFFLNVGYEEDPPMAIPLEPSDEIYRPCIQLYYRVATQADLAGKQILEVGCGHGGGAAYLMRTLKPALYTGLDLNGAGIDFCRRTYSLTGLDFVQGNAQNLPFPDRSFDVVINIESSLFYPKFSQFLTEVARVLRPSGHFLYADARPSYKIAEWEAQLANAPLRMSAQREINEEVRRGSTGVTPQRLGPYARIGAVAARFSRGRTVPEGKLEAAPDDASYRVYCFVKD